MDEETIWGRNPVMEALRAGRPCNKILIARGSRGGLGDLISRAQREGIPVQLYRVAFSTV